VRLVEEIFNLKSCVAYTSLVVNLTHFQLLSEDRSGLQKRRIRHKPAIRRRREPGCEGARGGKGDEEKLNVD